MLGGDPGGEGVSSIFLEEGLGEVLESHRERSLLLHLFHSTVRVMGPPEPALVAMCLNSNRHKQQYTLSSTAISIYLGLLKRGRRSREGSGEKELFQQRGGEE